VDAVRVARPGGRGRPRQRPDHLTGDKAYSSRANRAALRARRIRHTIPERDDQKVNRARKGARGGRPPAFDRDRYKRRNQVERLMNRRKQFRAVATRFDKLAERYAATVAVADIFIWLRARRPAPRRSEKHALGAPDASVTGSAGDDPFVRLAGDVGDALVVRVVVEHDGGVGLGDGGEHEVGDRGSVLPAEGQRGHDVDQVLLGGRVHVQ
jgi:transposase